MMIGNVWTDISLATDCDLNQGDFSFLIYINTLLLTPYLSKKAHFGLGRWKTALPLSIIFIP
jgi:hypothetical protein